MNLLDFAPAFHALTGNAPLPLQRALSGRFRTGNFPASCQPVQPVTGQKGRQPAPTIVTPMGQLRIGCDFLSRPDHTADVQIPAWKRGELTQVVKQSVLNEHPRQQVRLNDDQHTRS